MAHYEHRFVFYSSSGRAWKRNIYRKNKIKYVYLRRNWKKVTYKIGKIKGGFVTRIRRHFQSVHVDIITHNAARILILLFTWFLLFPPSPPFRFLYRKTVVVRSRKTYGFFDRRPPDGTTRPKTTGRSLATSLWPIRADTLSRSAARVTVSVRANQTNRCVRARARASGCDRCTRRARIEFGS